MKFLKTSILPFALLLGIAVLPACSKKVMKPSPPFVAPASNTPTTPPPAQEKPAPAPEKPAPAPAPAPPDYNFSNIQFEFNSGILKTDAYPILDKAAAEMKKDQSVKFVLNGNSSAEGTEEHNMALSVERANAVKTYLVNTGVNGANLEVKGYGESKPITSNATEEGRALNRRVEIKKQ
ncbi:OmpA family protein [Mucilaginibacter sp. 14171R-50]|uniref:OmpA family protein n=1 Tax=Mucilaginibacter sp. 14171R-50 TaxID=2703789 RepID=UPI00138B5063|nr:OmpA family protein [Mucilaginibacter sp. 14171R-50]QHS54124.1 OmpA family protein [Mucilaginibacter sp. 14171R-50]